MKTLCLHFCFLVGGWGTLWKQYFVSSTFGGTLITEKLQGFVFITGHISFYNTRLSLRNDVPLISMTWSFK